MQSVSDFWNRLDTSGVVAAGQLEGLKTTAQEAQVTQDAEQLAAWLVTQNILTSYQAEGLRTGALTFFHWHEFLILEPVARGPFEYQMRARHVPTQHPVILLELNERSLRDSGGLPGLFEACEVFFSDSSFSSAPLLIPREILSVEGICRAVYDDPGGTPLSTVLSGGSRLSVSAAAAFIASCAEALAILHSHGLLHGGVSPQTVWLPRKGSAQLLLAPPWLSAKKMRPALSVNDLDYAAPERYGARPEATAAADLYALGCTLFEILSGRPPFACGQGVSGKMERHRSEPITSLQSYGVPAKVEQIVCYMMAKDPKIRYQSASTIAEALRTFILQEDAPKMRAPTAALQGYLAVCTSRRKQQLSELKPPTESVATVEPPEELSGEEAAPATSDGDPSANRPDKTGSDHPAPHAAPPSSDASQAARIFEQVSQNDPSPRSSRHKRDHRTRSLLWATLGVICGIGLWLAVEMGRPSGTEKSLDPPVQIAATNSQTPRPTAEPMPETAPPPNALDRALPEDDGKTLWAAPTQGTNHRLRYLPPGPQMILMLNGQSLARESWAGVRSVAGEPANAAVNVLIAMSGFEIGDIERIDLGVYSRGGNIETAAVYYLTTGYPIDQLKQRWKTTDRESYNGESIHLSGSQCYYQPPGKRDIFTVGRREDIHQVIDWLGEETQLDGTTPGDARAAATPLASLVESSDDGLDLQLFFNANFIRSQRSALFSGIWAPLHAATTWLVGPGEAIQAGAVSLNLDRTFFCELRFYCSRDKRPASVAETIYNRLSDAPTMLNTYLLGLRPSDYGRQTLALMPDMLRSLTRYTRHDQDRPRGRQAILRAHLPPDAAAHLALAVELLLYESHVPTTIPQSEETPVSLNQKLKLQTTLSFDRENLLQAVTQLAESVGIEIQILGSDLEQEGITQNQSFGIDLQNRPAVEILEEILRRANPTQGVALSDAAQELIYVIDRGDIGSDSVLWITTREAAKQRGDKIPTQFK